MILWSRSSWLICVFRMKWQIYVSGVSGVCFHSFYSANVAFRAPFLFQELLMFFCANAPTSSKLLLNIKKHKDEDKDKTLHNLIHNNILLHKYFIVPPLLFCNCDRGCFTVYLDIEKLWPQYILITGSVICSRKYQNNNLLFHF